MPVPCHPDCLAMAYALKLGGKVVPLTRLLDPTKLLEMQGNTILNEQDPEMRRLVVELFSTSHSPDSSAWTLAAAPLLPAGARRAAAVDV